MRKYWWLPLALTVVFAFAIGGYDPARAVPASPQQIGAAAATSDVQPTQVVVRGRVVVRGGGGRVVVRGGVRGGAYRVGGRYYGGVWYGARRHYWGGRWYPYGVGSCWRPTPVGFVWICE